MPSNDNTVSTKKIKRTSFSPWNSGMMASRAKSGNSQLLGRSSELARIAVDIVENAAVKSSAMGLLAGNSKIMAAQKEWERSQSASLPGDGENTAVGAQVRGGQDQPISRSLSTTPMESPVPLPPQPSMRKRDAPALEALGAKRPNMATSSAQRSEDALRLTEAEVVKQVSELTSKPITPSLKASVMNATASQGPSMSFTSPADLLKRVMAEGARKGSQSSSLAPGDSQFETSQTESAPFPPAPIAGDLLEPMRMAEPNRAYSFFQDPDNGLISARGALIPANYQLYDDPELPFVCPVRDCRRLFPGLKGLGGHFGAGHCSTTFNDNGDGTLTKVGAYARQGTGGSPAIVISNNPLPPDAPPLVDASLPFMATQKRNSLNAGALERKSLRLSEASVKASASPTPILAVNTELQEYLHQFLSPSQKVWPREDITYMLSQRRKRTLPEVWTHFHRGSELDAQHYACALAYLTGREVNNQDRCMAAERNHRSTSRLGQPCISLPHNMHIAAKNAFSGVATCVGCRYYSHLQRRSNQCDWIPDHKVKGIPSSNMGISSVAPSVEDSAGPEVIDVDELAQSVAETDSVAESAPEQRRVAQRAARSSIIGRSAVRDVSMMSGGLSLLGANELEMEEWEMAPGRMQDDSTSDNIAFSNSYLTSGQPVTISEDVSFNVLVIKPGGLSHWAVEDEKLRTCSLASGKVRVTMGDKSFQLGPNGIFVVKPGQSCKIENRLYLDSVVHCMTIAGFALQ